jgi:hypothetical protein
LQPLLPSLFEAQDAGEILTEVLKNSKSKSPNQNMHVFCSTMVLTEQFIQKLTKPFDAIIQKKAEEVYLQNVFQAFILIFHVLIIEFKLYSAVLLMLQCFPQLCIISSGCFRFVI